MATEADLRQHINASRGDGHWLTDNAPCGVTLAGGRGLGIGLRWCSQRQEEKRMGGGEPSPVLRKGPGKHDLGIGNFVSSAFRLSGPLSFRDFLEA